MTQDLDQVRDWAKDITPDKTYNVTGRHLLDLIDLIEKLIEREAKLVNIIKTLPLCDIEESMFNRGGLKEFVNTPYNRTRNALKTLKELGIGI